MKPNPFYRILIVPLFLLFTLVIIPAGNLLAQISHNPKVQEEQRFEFIEIILIAVLILNAILLYYFIRLQKNKRAGSSESSNKDQDKKLLYTLIDNMPDRIYIKDRKSRFIAANVHVSKIMGQDSPKTLIGRSDFDFYRKELAQEYYQDEQSIMESGNPLINKEERGLDLSGNEITVSTTKVPVRNDQGEVIGIVGIGRDITLQKQNELKLLQQQVHLQEANVALEERQEEIQQQSEELHAQSEYLLKVNLELEKLSLVASHTDNVIFIMDADANLEWGNIGFEKQTGLSNESLKKGNPVNLRNISANKEIGTILDDIALTKKAFSYEACMQDSNGSTNWSQTTISPVMDSDGRIIKLIAIDTDITKLKEAEGEIERNRDELKKLNATKDKFFSIIAHDLKNPFHSIMGFTELLIRSYESIEDERKREFLQLIKDSSTSAYNLLENLLDWSRTQTNRIKFTPANINISLILYENIQMHGLIAENKGITISHDIPDMLMSYADSNMVNTVVRNLLTNALKFTPGGGNVAISGKEDNGKILVLIRDNGLGMDQSTREKLFKIDEFHNTVGTSGETGTGLGLIICKEFIIKNGGEIYVDSEPGKGSTFSFTLLPAKSDPD